jgi:hypothetical protein
MPPADKIKVLPQQEYRHEDKQQSGDDSVGDPKTGDNSEHHRDAQPVTR